MRAIVARLNYYTQELLLSHNLKPHHLSGGHFLRLSAKLSLPLMLRMLLLLDHCKLSASMRSNIRRASSSVAGTTFPSLNPFLIAFASGRTVKVK